MKKKTFPRVCITYVGFLARQWDLRVFCNGKTYFLIEKVFMATSSFTFTICLLLNCEVQIRFALFWILKQTSNIKRHRVEFNFKSERRQPFVRNLYSWHLEFSLLVCGVVKKRTTKSKYSMLRCRELFLLSLYIFSTFMFFAHEWWCYTVYFLW